MACLSGGSFTGLIPQIPTLPTPPDIHACVPDIFPLLQGGGAFQNPIAGPLADCLDLVQSIFDAPAGFPTSGANFDTITSVQSILGTTGYGGAPGLLTHSNGLIANMPSLMSGGNSLMKGTTAMSAVAGAVTIPTNPCELLDGIMGSVLGAANDAVNAIEALLDPILAVIAGPLQGILDAITAAAGLIATAVGALAGLIIDEIANLADFLGNIANFSFANSIPGLAADPCLQAIFNALGTPDLINCLAAGVPDFNVF